MLSLSKLLSIAFFATAVVAGPFNKRQDDPALNPATPANWTSVFGPVTAATNAPAYMGLQEFATYDVQACTDACTARAPDSEGGNCVFVNIWRALNDGVVGTTTCGFYYVATDESTATNLGQGNTTVTYSRGYRLVTQVGTAT